MTTIAGGILTLLIHSWIRDRKRKNLILQSRKGDVIFDSNLVQHFAACHCQRLRFSIYSHKIIKAVDIDSKIRFPRLTVPIKFFESHSDSKYLSLYPVKQSNNNIGVYSFCNICGMHILFSSANNPYDIQINSNCLDDTNIEQYIITYHNISDNESFLSKESHIIDINISKQTAIQPYSNTNSCNAMYEPELSSTVIELLSPSLPSPLYRLQLNTVGLICMQAIPLTSATTSHPSNQLITSSDTTGMHTSVSHSHSNTCTDTSSTLLETWASLTNQYEHNHITSYTQNSNTHQTNTQHINKDNNSTIEYHLNSSHLLSESDKNITNTSYVNHLSSAFAPSTASSSVKSNKSLSSNSTKLASIETLKKHLQHHLPPINGSEITKT